MANTISSFFQTVVAAATEASAVLAPTWNALDSIYWDYNTEQPGVLGQTLNIAIPADPSNQVQDIGSGDVILSDASTSTVPIVFSKHPQVGYTIRDFEQFNSPTMLRNLFMDSYLKGIKSNINGNITALFNTANFTTNAAISATTSVITVTQFLQGQARLLDQRVTALDPENVSLLLPATPYTAMTDASSTAGAFWTQAQIASNAIAEEIRRTGQLKPTFGATIKMDQQMPTTGAAGSRTFTGAYFHRYAVAGVSRPLPKPDEKVVDYTYVNFGKIIIRVQIGYNQYPKGGYIVTLDAGYGLKVVRENMGQLFTIAE